MTGYPHQRGPQVGQHIGDYELVSHLARGDMGEVFQAHHPKSGRQLAIKVLDAELCADPQLLQFYEHEVWTVNHLDHPAIVDVVDFGKLDNGRAYLVMKLLRGRSLAEHLAEHGRFSVADARELMLPALEALVAVHGAGVTHKDLKPSNIFLVQRPDGGFAPQLLDTGLAHLKPLAAVPGSAAQRAGNVMPLYSPPEQIAGDLQAVGPWSDIYAASAVLFHLLAGRPPYIGSTAQELADQHLQSPPPDLAELRKDVHPAVARVLQQGLAKRPAERFETMDAFLKAFHSASSRPAPTLRGATAVPDEPAPPPTAVPPTAAPSPDAPPPTVHLNAAVVPGAPPPTMHMHPAPAPAPVHPAAVGVSPQPPSYTPPLAVPPRAPAAPLPAGRVPSRNTGLWAVFIIGGLLLVVGVVAGLILALRSGKKEEESGSASAPVKQADATVPRRRTPVPPMVAVTPAVPKLPTADRYRIDIRNRPWKGATHARATVVVYCGFSGYYCRTSADSFRRLALNYPQDVKLVWMDYPLRYYKRAMPAAVAAAEVHAQRGRAGFWKMHERLYANAYKHTDDNLVKWAIEAGADGSKVRAAVTGLTHKKAIESLVEKAKAIGVHYTPAVFVNGIRIKDPKRGSELEARVKEEIALAKKTIAAGSATLQGYYAHVQKNALLRKRGLGLSPRFPTRPPRIGSRLPTTPRTWRRHIPSADTVYHLPVTQKNPQRGPADALVTVVLFGDFECYFTFRLVCALRAVWPKWKRDVRVVWMNNPRTYHNRALRLAQAAFEAFGQKGNKGFWALHDRLFPVDLCRADGTARFGFFTRRRKATDKDLEDQARRVGVSVPRLRRALSSATHKSRVLAEQKLAKGLWAYSTPTMFINGKKVTGSKKTDELRKLLGDARSAARKTLRQKRVTRRKLYETIIAQGRRPRLLP